MSIENQKNESDLQEKVNALIEAINEPADVETKESVTYKMMLHAIVKKAIGDTDILLELKN